MMSKRRLIKTAGAGALTAGLGLAGCGGPGGGMAHLRFKVIARARLGGDDYEGFAVNEMKARYTPGRLIPMMMGRTLKMEATVVDFGGKTDALYVLLTDYLPVILIAWDIPGPGSADETTIPRLKAAQGSREIPLRHPSAPDRKYHYYPKIAAFRDEADPASIYEVDPDNLAKTHGPGAKFLGLSIEIVDPKTPLTESIQQRLGWLEEHTDTRLVPLTPGLLVKDATFGQLVSHGAFKSGR